MSRAQASLPVLAVALLVVTSVAGISFTIADDAYAGADRDSGERRVAVALSERLVSAESTVTADANVLDSSRIAELDTRLRSQFPVVEGYDVRVRLDDETVARTGDAGGGTTIRRIVLVEREQRVMVTPSLSPPNHSVTLPRRTSSVTLDIEPPGGTTVTTVRANGRVILRNESGLDGRFDVAVTSFETTRFTFDVEGPLPRGAVSITYHPVRTSKAMLEVTVDA